MTPVPAVSLIARLVGYLLFLAWCGVVVVAIAAVELFRLGRLASRWGGREPARTLP